LLSAQHLNYSSQSQGFLVVDSLGKHLRHWPLMLNSAGIRTVVVQVMSVVYPGRYLWILGTFCYIIVFLVFA
jgi:hypothetical protein